MSDCSDFFLLHRSFSITALSTSCFQLGVLSRWIKVVNQLSQVVLGHPVPLVIVEAEKW
ncbi:5661_t:CDS:2, partial [Gigaspora margarita]